MRYFVFTLAAVVAGSLCARWLAGPSALAATPDTHVRNAGPESMQNPPEEWDLIDEASDESFPASDPPGGY